MKDPLLRLSRAARVQLARFVHDTGIDVDEVACTELERFGLIDWCNPVVRPLFPLSEKGIKAWRAEP